MTSDETRLLGATIAGKYRIDKIIGSGAMGVVCAARHIELGRRVAIKLIESSLAENDEVAARFRRESRAASSVESENIVQIFDAGVDPEHGLYMVMEHLVGEDLESRLKRVGRLDVTVAANLAQQIARALSKAHAAHIVHRDLKPANVFLVPREGGGDTVKVLDFGISLILHPDLSKSGELKLTQVGMAVGTPQYSSPEQVQGLPDIDYRTDIWSLGVVFYEMLAGRPAYPETATYEEFVARLMTQEPDRLTDVAPWVPPALAAVVHAAVRHDVGQRLPDCATFARLIAQAAPEALQASARSRDPAVPKPRASRRDVATAEDTIQVAALEFDDIDIEPDPPSGTLVMSSMPDLEEPLPRAPDSDNFPTRPRASASAPGTPPSRPIVSGRASAVDSGGIIFAPPPSRARLPTLPSFARTEEASRRRMIRNALLAAAVVIILGGGGALALLLWQ